MKYKIQITETLQKVVTVNADNEDDAYLHIRRKYNNCEIVLDSNDFTNVEFQNIQ